MTDQQTPQPGDTSAAEESKAPQPEVARADGPDQVGPTDEEVGPADGSDETSQGPTGGDVDARIGELTADLQRLQAEYVNYKRRVDRDRELIVQNATYKALAPIVDVLDNIDRAREHGPLDDGFKAVAEQLERTVANAGLTKFGEPGEVFDPTLHEALSHLGTDPEVSETTVKVLAKAGYRIGDRVVRAAQVLVVDPE